MATLSFALRRHVAEIVYCGPALGGKTTTLERIAAGIPGARLLRPEGAGARTLLFDLLPLLVPLPDGWTLQLNLKTLPGQALHGPARLQGLRDPDAVVFVADSRRARAGANRLAVDDLRRTLEANGRALEEVPLVFQYNHQDGPDLQNWDEMQERLNPADRPAFGSVAHEGRGILLPLGAAMDAILARLHARLGGAGH